MVIAGPTASGKSALALKLANMSGGDIINADSMQVYKDLTILSARPTAADMALAPHHLFGTIDGAQMFSVAEWRDAASCCIEALWARGRLPIVVGGSGLYLRSLIDGISAVPTIPEAIRKAVRALETAALATALHTEDAAMATRLDPADRQRQTRALEVIRATGQSLAHFQGEPVGGLAGKATIIPLVISPDRAVLYNRSNQRLTQMVGEGALEEVEALMKRGLEPALPVMKALGVAELASHLRGDISLDDAVTQAQQATRNYAKRQMTWFRNQFEGWNAININYEINDIVIILRKYGLTMK